MGLDMYLEAHRVITDTDACMAILDVTGPLVQDYFVNADGSRGEDCGVPQAYLGRWSHFDEDSVAKADTVIELAGLTALVGEDSNSVVVRTAEGGLEVSLTGAYWRKANAVHAWFVENVQGGVDECQSTEVHPESLAALRSACQRALVLAEAGDLRGAAEIMPTREGFFFGGTEMNEWWASTLLRTVTEIERLMTAAITERVPVRFYYQASW